MRVDTLTPVLDAAPGELVIGRVRVVNDGADDATFTMRVVGLDGQGVVYEVPGGPVGPGLSAEVDVPLEVPPALGVGQHAVALEVSSDRSDERPALARLTVSIDSLERVQLAPRPSTVRAGRSGRFTLDVLNNELTTVDVLLGGEAPDVAVVFDPPMVRLHPGERGWVRGKIRAKQRWGGDSLHHVLTLTARGRSSTTSTTMAYIQRPVVPGKALNAMAAIVLIAMFLGAIGGGLWWWGQRDTTETATTPDGRLGQLDGVTTAADGSTGADGTAGGNGTDPDGAGPGADGGADAPTGPGAIPTFTVLTGTVSTSDGSPAGVTVRLAPIDLGGQIDDDAAIVGVAGASRGPAKIWSARHAVRPSVMTPVRQTESVLPISTDGDGVWRFVDIPIRQNYELAFSKAGYNTQSFVVTPPADGSRVELDVELEAATGQLSGVVVGPEGALGGVDILVTDGDLTFRTTSATEASGTGQVGSFAIEGLNTPAVYTLSATLRGYGTEVVQLPFSAGQERSGTTVSMQAGVGSISGRVTTGGEPRGGVTITASNGDDTFTTTSLTEGDVGAYTIPRLDIPGEYTVTATLPGFIAQTRRVVLAGNAAGTDFQLVPTTAGISGQVRSSNGNPIVGAGITVSVDDVGFRSATAASPVPGSFNIGDLPPGTYLVRISRFDHLPYSQQVTVGAGQTVDLGEITLEFSARPPIASLGSIAVRVFDSEDADLEGATVSIYGLTDRVGVDEPIASISDEANEQSTFVFDGIPIGTYRVRVTRPIFRTVERRVSVGLGRENVEFRMLRLGQASGQIVVADGRPLRDYAFNLYRLEPSGAETFVEEVRVPASRGPDDEGRILWESTPESLITGTYRIEIVNQPSGYVVRPNQVVDESVTQSPQSMLFRVPADSEEPVLVDDLVADPLPLIGGRLFVPRLDGQSTTMSGLDPAEVAAIADLEVRLVCGDNTVVADVPPLRPEPGQPDPIQPYQGFRLPLLDNHFEFTPFALQAANVSGACRIQVDSRDFIGTDEALAVNIAPVAGAIDPPQRTINVGLLEESDPFFGRVFWKDGTVEVDLPDVTITSDDDTVIGSTPRQGENFGDTNPPRVDPGSIEAQTGPDGRFTFTDLQLFGVADYTVAADAFGDGVLRIRLDDGGNPATTPVRTITEIGGLRHEVLGDGSVDIELVNPEPGELSGEVRIRTTRPVGAFDDVGRRAEGPGGVIDPVNYGAFDPTDLPTEPRPIFVQEVAAGTWEVVFALPPNHEFFDIPADQLLLDPGGDPALTRHRVEQRVQPRTGAVGFDTDIVELATVEVDVQYALTDQPPVPPLPVAPSPDVPADQVSIKLRSDNGDDRSATVDNTTFDRLPVDTDDPVANPLGYELDVIRPGYDETAATVTLTDRTDPASPAVDQVSSSLDVAFDLSAGSNVLVSVTMPQYGTLTGTVFGVGASKDILKLEDGLLEVDARRVTPTGVEIVVGDPRIVVGESGNDDTSFTLTGPPGRYEIEVGHPFYEDPPTSVPMVDPSDPFSAPLPLRIENQQRTMLGDKAWELAVKRSTLVLTALGSLDTDDVPVPVIGARVTLTPSVGPAIIVPTGFGGIVEIDDILPGQYKLEVRRFRYFPLDGTWDTFTDFGYPVIGTLDIAPGDSEADRTIEVTVKLPSLTGKIDGKITAVNSNWTPDDEPDTLNRVPVPLGTVTREYVPSPIELASGGTVPNEVDATTPITPTQVTSFITTGPPDALDRAFVFDRLPGGTHRLTFAIPPGYTLDGVGPPDDTELTIDQEVDDTEDVSADTSVSVTYRALDVSLVVELDYADGIEPLTPKVVLRDGADNELGAPVRDGTTFTFTGVPPMTTPYKLVVTDELAGPSGGTAPVEVVVAPNGDGHADTPANAPVQVETVAMEAIVARIEGNVQQVDEQGGAGGALQAKATIKVTDAAGREAAPPIEIENGSVTRYRFEFDSPDVYTVTVQKDGYTSSSESVQAVLGETKTVDTVVVRKSATATVSVANHDGDTTVVAFAPSNPSPEIQGVRDGGEWTFSDLEPGVGYRFRVNRPGYYQVFFPSATTQLVPDIGGNYPLDAGTLIERVLNVNTTVGLPNSTKVTATVTIGSTTIGPLDSDGVNQGNNPAPSFVFRSTDRSTTQEPNRRPLPLTGGGTVVLSVPNYRSHTLEIPTFADSFVAAGTAASERTQTLTAPVFLPNVTKIEGTITGTTEEVEVTLTGPGSWNPVTSSFDIDENTYSFSGAFPVGDYTVTVDELGVGTGSETFSITAAWPSEATAKVERDLDVTARNVTVTFTDAPTTASVLADTQDPALELTGTDPIQFVRSEREVARTYQVRNDGSVWEDVDVVLGDVSINVETGALTVSKSVPLLAFPTFGGTITVAGEDDDPAPAAEVSLAQGACPQSGTTVNANSDGVYTGLTLAAGGPKGDYCISATFDGRSDSRTIEIPDAAIIQNLVIPAPPAED